MHMAIYHIYVYMYMPELHLAIGNCWSTCITYILFQMVIFAKQARHMREHQNTLIKQSPELHLALKRAQSQKTFCILNAESA